MTSTVSDNIVSFCEGTVKCLISSWRLVEWYHIAFSYIQLLLHVECMVKVITPLLSGHTLIKH